VGFAFFFLIPKLLSYMYCFILIYQGRVWFGGWSLGPHPKPTTCVQSNPTRVK